jgi:hypothetical protein
MRTKKRTVPIFLVGAMAIAYWIRTFIISADNPAAAPRMLWDMSSDELYKHPGFPVYRVLPTGTSAPGFRAGVLPVVSGGWPWPVS